MNPHRGDRRASRSLAPTSTGNLATSRAPTVPVDRVHAYSDVLSPALVCNHASEHCKTAFTTERGLAQHR